MNRLVDVLTLGPMRRRRSFDRQLREWDRDLVGGSRAGPSSDPRAWSPAEVSSPPVRRDLNRPRNSRRSMVIAAILVFSMCGGAGDVLRGLRDVGVPVDNNPLAVVYAADRPVAGYQESRHPLGHPPAPPAGSGGYAFLSTLDGAPVTYDPCRPLHYVIRNDGEDAQLRRALRDSVAAASDASGLTFVYDGTSTEKPSNDRDPYQPGRYGHRWAPILIAFSNPTETSALKGDVIGDGGSTSVDSGDALDVTARQTYVSGQVRLDTPQLMAVRDCCNFA